MKTFSIFTIFFLTLFRFGDSYGDIDFWSEGELYDNKYPTIIKQCEPATFEEHARLCAKRGGRLFVTPSVTRNMEYKTCKRNDRNTPIYVGLYSTTGTKGGVRYVNGAFFVHYNKGYLEHSLPNKCFTVTNGGQTNYKNTDCDNKFGALCQLTDAVKVESIANYGAVFNGPFQGGIEVIINPHKLVIIRGAIGSMNNFVGAITVVLLRDMKDPLACNQEAIQSRSSLMSVFKYFSHNIGSFTVSNDRQNFGNRINIEGNVEGLTDWDMDSYSIVVISTGGSRLEVLDCARVKIGTRKDWLAKVSEADLKYATGL